MAPKIFEMIPFLRAPLLLNSSVALILGSVEAAQLDRDWWRGEGILDVMAATITFFGISIISTTLFAYHDYRLGSMKVNGGRRVVPTNLVKGIADLSLGFGLLVLHIVNSTVANNSGDVVLVMYIGFGALTASIFHFVLAIHSVSVAMKAWKMSNNWCPTCHQRLRQCDSPVIHATEAGPSTTPFTDDRKGADASIANRAGSLEGDRLIIPGDDEA